MFEKGYIPHNKGIKGFRTSGSFKRGMTPWNKDKKTEIKPWLGKKRPNLINTKAKTTMFKKGMKPWNKGLIGVYSINKAENNPQWKGGLTPLNKIIRRSKQYKTWRNSIFLRDNFTCQMCGVRGKEIHPNHIKKFSDYPKLRFNLNNGITLCKSCHFGLVNHHEKDWVSYFNFNLETRGVNYAER